MSVRRHNAAIPVSVFVYGDLPPAAMNRLQAHDVRVRRLESYAATLAKLSPHAAALSSYLVLPKYLSLVELAELELSQLVMFGLRHLLVRRRSKTVRAL